MDHEQDAQAALPATRFSLTLTVSGTRHDFTDPHAAGAAYFAADPAERPSVIAVENGTARTMARTGISGQHKDGSLRHAKSLPDSHGPDADFRSGYFDAMETSLADRLGKSDWLKDGTKEMERFDPTLKSDLEAFARHAPELAAALWSEASEAEAPGPILRAAVLERDTVRDLALARYQDALAQVPPIIATGDWVTTDQDVALRPVAVATERGIHAGYEAQLPDGKEEVTFSEQTFPSPAAALRQAWNFYEGGEPGIERNLVPEDIAQREIDHAAGADANHGTAPFEPLSFPDVTITANAPVPNLERSALARNPSAVITAWIKDMDQQIGKLPQDLQQGLRTELRDITKEATTAFGAEGLLEASATPPRSTLYSTALNTLTHATGREERPHSEGAATSLKASLLAAAAEVGIDSSKMERRLEGGATNVREEEAWVKSDLAEVAARHNLDLREATARNRAANLVDHFYEQAATLVHHARNAATQQMHDPLQGALIALATAHDTHGAASFRTEDQARDFADDMKARYGANVLQDVAQGRTEVLARDISDPAARQAIALAVLAAAKEHPSLDIAPPEIEASERAHAAHVQSRGHRSEHARDRGHDRDL